MIDDMNEALRLMKVSKKSLFEDGEQEQEHDRSDVSKVFCLIKEMAKQVPLGKKDHEGQEATGQLERPK